MSLIHPVVLSGGSGTRLWPLSREHYPKQLLSLVGDNTLLQQAVLRADGLTDIGDSLIVCNEEHRFLVAEQLRELKRSLVGILLEPFGRNTAPAATLAALFLAQREPDALMLLMPADHTIGDVPAFHRSIAEGVRLAREGAVVTFGIVPTAPETGYGYILRGEGHRVVQFVEKPDFATAQGYLRSGNYLWNSGIFCVRVDVWIAEMERWRPDIAAACRAALAGGVRDADFFRVHGESFRSCPSDSIDYAVMEKTDRAAVVSMDAGWSDIGAWPALWQVCEQDASGNVTRGDVLTHGTRNALVIAQHRLVATVGIEDTIVVETPDAVLVARKGHAQDVRNIVEQLKLAGRGEHLMHRRVFRPWGSYECLDTGERFQVKRLVIKPGAAISLQLHQHRAEHWIVVKGTARVTRGEEVFMLTENQSTDIPIGARHRLENLGNIALEIIEVQSGSYLGEDDIQRFDDIYNRHATQTEKK